MNRTNLMLALSACAFCMAANVAAAGIAGGGSQPWLPEANTKAFWVETSICSVVVKTQIDAAKPIQTGTPIDLLSTMPAICTSSVTGQNQFPGGVRSLLANGFRVTAMSHHVAVLSGPAHADSDELLISALFSLERPQAAGVTR